MGARGEKFLQARRRQRDGVGPNDAGDIKAQCSRGADQFRLKGGEI
jgi:hypothetical protein